MNADLMSTIENLQRQSSADGILGLLHDSFARHGFHSFIVSTLPASGTHLEPQVLLCDWNEVWFERYARLDYFRHDPVARHCFNTILPFDWSDAPYDSGNVPARRVMEEARDFGMDQGWCIPVHLNGEMQGAVSMAGPTDHLDALTRMQLHMLALYVHGRLRSIGAKERPLRPTQSITRREVEILQWVASGKTAAEIADITGLTARTINQHCENAQRRLGTSNRLHTVVEAIRYKLIDL